MNALYKIQKLNNGDAAARGIEYHEAVSFLATELKANPKARYNILPEEFMEETWWEIHHRFGSEVVYAWGDDKEAEAWVAYLNAQQRSRDHRLWCIRPLPLREAFALGLNDPTDGLNLADAIDEVRTELLESLDSLVSEIETLTAPSLFDVTVRDIERGVAVALRMGERLEALGIVVEGTRTTVLKLLEREGWTLDGESPVPLKAMAA